MSRNPQKGAGKPRTSRKAPEISRTSPSQGKRESRRIVRGCLSGHQDFLIGQVSRGRFVCEKRQLQVIDDAVHH
ncbi:MAG: hypothetical protein OEV56_07110, partial [Dehalococcoidia bacterium]|nr:hypothetical protein [Dehalococcoidia bacterium]